MWFNEIIKLKFILSRLLKTKQRFKDSFFETRIITNGINISRDEQVYIF